jgi:hypothetical protein
MCRTAMARPLRVLYLTVLVTMASTVQVRAICLHCAALRFIVAGIVHHNASAEFLLVFF